MNNNAQERVQMLLYKYPLFKWQDADLKEMNLLVVGDSEYAVSFVDLCLQVGQTLDNHLVIHWCVLKNDTKEKYLEKRPALSDFISVNNEACSDPYATIYYHELEGYLDSVADTCKYIFAATNDKQLNHEIVETLTSFLSRDRFFSYYDGKDIKIVFNEKDDLDPTDVNQKESSVVIEDDLKRMAFNTHITWEGLENLNYSESKKRFSDPYYYNSSVSFVLSIPYKLKSFGIETKDIYIAAKEFAELLDESYSDSYKSNLIYKAATLEHRRWVMEKATEGVVNLPENEYEETLIKCIYNGSLKNVDNSGNLKMHPCLVRSTDDNTLSKYTEREWNDANSIDEELDDLDKTSIKIHRIMNHYSVDRKKNHSFLDSLMGNLRKECAKTGGRVKRDFDRYSFCVQNVLNGNKSYSSKFERYEKNLIDKLLKTKTSVDYRLGIIKKIRVFLFPIIESNLYRDYKEYDIEMVRNIPFILTAKPGSHICQSLGELSSSKFNNDYFFKSVASATALYASRLTYICICEKNTNFNVLASKLKAIKNYFEYRGSKCKLQVIGFISESESRLRKGKFEECLQIAKKGKAIGEYDILFYSSHEELCSSLSNILEKNKPDYFDGSTPLSCSGYLSAKLTDAISKITPYYEFDSFNQSFRNCICCDYLGYNKLMSYISVEDMFSLMNAQDKSYNYPDCIDLYTKCWGIYNGSEIGVDNFALCSSSWTKMIGTLKNAKRLKLEKAKIKGVDEKEIAVVAKMLEGLEREGLLTEYSITGKSISATFPSKRIKEFLSNEGLILEMHVYYQGCYTNYFDDIQTGYKFKWEFDDVDSELDCILTKGYRTILVECKARKKADESFYMQLDTLGDHFGIGCNKVLLLVTDSNRKGYEKQVSRGKQLDIITISSSNLVNNIGSVLKDIIDGNWESV